MPPIQQRLLKARYSEYNLHIPNSTTIRNKLNQPFRSTISDELTATIINLIANPPLKDKHFRTNHYKIVRDYLSHASMENKKKLLNRRLIKPIMYFYKYPSEYYSNYELFSIPLLHHILCGMRKSTILHRIKIGELPKSVRADSVYSNGNYEFVKPMTNKCSVVLGHSLLGLVESNGLC